MRKKGSTARTPNVPRVTFTISKDKIKGRNALLNVRQHAQSLVPPDAADARRLDAFLLIVGAFVWSLVERLRNADVCFDVPPSGLLAKQSCNVQRLPDLDLPGRRIATKAKNEESSTNFRY